MTQYLIIQRGPESAHMTENSETQNFVLLFSSIFIAIKVYSILMTMFNESKRSTKAANETELFASNSRLGSLWARLGSTH